VQPIALRLYDGARASDGYVLARDDAALSSAKDLRGRTICLVDRESTTGFLLPRIWMRDAGLDPDKDVRTIISGDHLAALRDLASQRCDAAAVYSGAYLSAPEQGIRVGSMRVLAITGRAPQDVMTCAPNVPAAQVERLKKLLLGFKPERDIDAADKEGLLPATDAGR
jgi:phosphonate transport system substrate-binding protein